jgi:hypothetical protein
MQDRLGNGRARGRHEDEGCEDDHSGHLN